MTDLGEWAPLSVAEVAHHFAGAPLRWWISGGHALDLHLGRSWRDHGDTDVGIVRAEAPALVDVLTGWDLHLASAGLLHPWSGRPLSADPADHEHNVWCRPTPSDPWAIDVTVGDGDATHWIYRRDPAVRVPWTDAVLRTGEGVPYLAPELQLLFKSVEPRPKDRLDASVVRAAVEPDRWAWLAQRLDPDHPFLED